MRQPLDAARITTAARESYVTRAEVHDRIGSTNARAAELGEHWVLIVADHQDAGRGRLGRTWTETPRAGLAMSILVPAPGAETGWLPLAAGLALRAAVADVTAWTPGLKWPNDLLDPATGRKVAGILCERVPAGVIVGSGLNVDHRPQELPVATATSVALAAGRSVGGIDRHALVGSYVARLVARYTALSGDEAGRRALRADYRAACLSIGADVVTEVTGAAPRPGRVLDVDDSGRLRVRRPGGEVEVLAAGDVHHARMAQ